MTIHIREQVTADSIIDAWMQDDTRLQEACEWVMDTLGHTAGNIADLRCALTGHPDDEAARAMRFYLSFKNKVRESMREDAEEQAQRENYVADDYGTDGLEAAA